MMALPKQFYDLIDDFDNNLDGPIVSIKNPKKVESKLISENIYQLCINDDPVTLIDIEEMVRVLLKDKYDAEISDIPGIKIIFSNYRDVLSKPYHISDQIVFFYDGSISPSILWQNGKFSTISTHCSHSLYGFRFINEQLFYFEEEPNFYNPFFMDYNFNVYCQKFTLDEVILHKNVRCDSIFIWDESRSQYLVDEELINYEIEKWFGYSFNLKNFLEYEEEKVKIPQEDKLQKVKINGEEFNLYQIKKLRSNLLNNLLETSNEITLPISRFDDSIECLDYLRAKCLEKILFKKYLELLKTLSVKQDE